MLAKFTPPRTYRPLKRTRLFRLLDRRRRQPLVWISGPPGSGKTTLVASYLEARKLKSVWFQVDEGDRDPATFFAYLSEAVATMRTRRRTPLPTFSADYLLDLAGFARRYFRALFRLMGQDTVLVLDNCHAAATQSMDLLLREAAAELPSGAGMILLSRMEAPASLSRKNLDGSLLELGWSELRLRLEESEAIARLRGATDQDVKGLHQRSDGWVAGLVALMSTGAARPPSRMRAGQRDLLFDYFANEIFDRATAAQQHVLTHTSLFARFTLSMAAAVSGESAVEELLDGLYRRQCFVERSGDNYQYHDLFREFLQNRLLSLAADQVRTVRLRTAQVLEQQNSIDAAIELRLEAGDLDAAAQMVRVHAPGMVGQGRHAQLNTWLSRLAEPLLEADPWLRYWLGMGQLLSDPQLAIRSLAVAHRGFQERNEVDGEFFAAEGAYVALQASWASCELLDPWIGALSARLLDEQTAASPAALHHGWYTLLCATLNRQLDHPLIEPAVNRLRARLFDGSLSDNQKLDVAAALLGFATLSTQRDAMAPIIALVEPIAAEEASAPVSRILWCFDYGSYLAQAGELDRALEVLTRGVALGKRFGTPGLAYLSHTMRAFGYWWRNETELARFDIEEMSRIGAAANFPRTVFEYKGRALLASRRGETELAMQMAELAVATADERGPAYMRSFARADMAPIAIQAGQLERAERWVSEGELIDRPTIVRINEAQYRLIRSTLAFMRKDRAAALDHLRDALNIARNPGVRGEMCASWPTLPKLFGEALNENIEPAIVTHLIKIWRIPAPSFYVERWPWRIKLFALGEFKVLVDEQVKAPARRAPVKVLELLKTLIVAGPAPIAGETLSDWLWPDSDGDAAAVNVRTNVLRLRQLLGEDSAVLVQDNKIALNQALCWVDAWAFEQLTTAGTEGARDEVGARLVGAIQLYRGHLLAQEQRPWIIPARERLHKRFAKVVHLLAQTESAPQDAARVLARAREIDAEAPR